MASLAKVLACLRHDEIPAQLHFSKTGIREFLLEGTRIAIPSALQPWPQAARRLAGISSFGFGGTNAHIIVEEAPTKSWPEGMPTRQRHILTVSARTESTLKNLAILFEKHLSEHPEDDLADICFSANAGRSHFARRLAVVAESKDEMRKALAAFTEGQSADSVVTERRCRMTWARKATGRAPRRSVWRRVVGRQRRASTVRHTTRV